MFSNSSSPQVPDTKHPHKSNGPIKKPLSLYVQKNELKMCVTKLIYYNGTAFRAI